MLKDKYNKYKKNNLFGRKEFISLSFIVLFSIIQIMISNLNGIVDTFMIGNFFSVGGPIIKVPTGGEIIIKNEEMALRANKEILEGLSYVGWYWLLLSTLMNFSLIGIGFQSAKQINKSEYRNYAASTNLKIIFLQLIFLPIIIFSVLKPEVAVNFFGRKQYIENFQLTENNVDEYFKYNFAIDEGAIYIRYITISWLIWSLSQVMLSITREMGKTKIAMSASITALVLNVILNFIFIKVYHLGIISLVVSTAISTFIELAIVMIFLVKYKLKWIMIFKTTGYEIYEEFKYLIKNRISFILFGLSWSILNIIRPILFNIYFIDIEDSSGNIVFYGASSTMAVFVIIQSMYTTLTESVNPVVFLKIPEAIKSQDKKYITTTRNKIITLGFVWSLFLVVTIIIFGIILPYMKAFFNVSDNLLQSSMYTTFALAIIFIPWIISTILRNIMSQGYGTKKASIIEIVYLALQTPLLIVIGIIHRNNPFDYFWEVYLLFYSTEFIKLVVFICFISKKSWYIKR
jgi:Na+-driven multidrug efflux pump